MNVDMEQLMRYTVATDEIRTRLLEEYPYLPVITSMIMAGDIYAAQQAAEVLHEGKCTWAEAINWCGSYSRLDAALRWQEEGYATREELLERWPDLWVGSDPDDTDSRFLEVWQEARAAHGDVVVDSRPLRRGQRLTVYRGQMPGNPVGIAWTLDKAIATKFAHGAAVRARMQGVVLSGTVKRDDIIAYLTDRNESEIIVDSDRVKLEGER